MLGAPKDDEEPTEAKQPSSTGKGICDEYGYVGLEGTQWEQVLHLTDRDR